MAQTQSTPAQTAPAVTIIDHELPYDTHNTYDVVFYGRSIYTTVACDPTIVTQWISDIESIHRHRLHQLIVGLDVEWLPNVSRYITNPAATLQLCVGGRCLIFQLIHTPSIPQSLVNFFANPNYTFVGVGIREDLEKLEDYEFGFNTKTVDLRGLAAAYYGRRDLKTAGLKTLASVVLDKEVAKPKIVRISRWDNQWLTPDQTKTQPFWRRRRRRSPFWRRRRSPSGDEDEQPQITPSRSRRRRIGIGRDGRRSPSRDEDEQPQITPSRSRRRRIGIRRDGPSMSLWEYGHGEDILDLSQPRPPLCILHIFSGQWWMRFLLLVGPFHV